MRNNEPQFPGLRQSNTDFGAVKSQLQTLPHHIDINLSKARTNGSDCLMLDIVGNNILIDAASTGFATIEFQNESFISDAPIFVTPGFTASFPFTRLKISNTQQNGKTLRLIYGVDTSFGQSQVSIVGSAGVHYDGQPFDPANVTGGSFGINGFCNGQINALSYRTLIAPTFNTYKGMIVNRIDLMAFHATNVTYVGVIAGSSPPSAAVFDENTNILLLTRTAVTTSATGAATRAFTDLPFKLDPGWGLYVQSELDSVSVVCNVVARVLR